MVWRPHGQVWGCNKKGGSLWLWRGTVNRCMFSRSTRNSRTGEGKKFPLIHGSSVHGNYQIAPNYKSFLQESSFWLVGSVGDGTKYKRNRKGQVQRLQTGEPIRPMNMFVSLSSTWCKNKCCGTVRFHIKTPILASPLNIRRFSNTGPATPQQHLAGPSGRACASQLPRAGCSTEYERCQPQPPAHACALPRSCTCRSPQHPL